jgi:excisionase family DNA binding protein
MSASPSTVIEPELLELRYLEALGYGHAQSIRTRIHKGEVPAVRVGNRFKIRREDLHHLTKPVGHSRPDAEDELDALVKKIVDGFPPLTDGQKKELGQLLAAACT